MPPLPNPKWEKYVQELVKGTNSEDAYEKAGYVRSSANASRLKVNPVIIDRYQELMSTNTERFVVTRQYLIDSAVELLEKCLGRRKIKAANGTEIYTFRAEAASKTLQMLGSEAGLFIDRKDISVKHGLDDMSDMELVKTLVKEGQYLLEHEAKQGETDGDSDPESVGDD